MHTREVIYEAMLRSARPALRLAAPLHPKLSRGLVGRAKAVERLVEWGEAERDLTRPLVWVHAPSVGEALMAQAIIGVLRERRPESQLIFTYFSPSAERISERVGADQSAYLPWDLTSESRRVLSVLRPDLIAFTRTEIWPILAREAKLGGTRLALVNAVLAEDSSRLRGPSRFLLGPGYARLDRVGAVNAGDAKRFTRLGVHPERVEVTGDARFDQVWGRITDLGGIEGLKSRPLLRRLDEPDALTIVAGSTWPADEERLIPAFVKVREVVEGVRMIIAPHEPSPSHLTGLEARLDAAGLSHRRLADLEGGGNRLPEVIVVDRVGILAELYALASLAYVGGGFGNAGLHSVVEPAALGIPVLFGPHLGNSLEAYDLARAGGGKCVRTAEALETTLLRLARNSVERAEASAAALIFVRSRLGGAARNARLLDELLEASGP